MTLHQHHRVTPDDLRAEAERCKAVVSFTGQGILVQPCGATTPKLFDSTLDALNHIIDDTRKCLGNWPA